MVRKFYLIEFDSIYDCDLENVYLRSFYEKNSHISLDSGYEYFSAPGKFKGDYTEWKDKRENSTIEEISSEWPKWVGFQKFFSENDFMKISEIFMTRSIQRTVTLKQILEE